MKQGLKETADASRAAGVTEVEKVEWDTGRGVRDEVDYIEKLCIYRNIMYCKKISKIRSW